MLITCNDPMFGIITYREHSWYKKETIYMFKRYWNIAVTARAYQKSPITDKQRNAYELFTKVQREWLDVATEQLKKYINAHIQEIIEYWPDLRSIDSVSDLAYIVIPKTLIIKQKGESILLFNCIWEREQGIGVQVFPMLKVGLQSEFL